MTATINQPRIIDSDGVVAFVNKDMGFADDSHSRYVSIVKLVNRANGPVDSFFVVLQHFNGVGRISYPIGKFPETLIARTRPASDEEERLMRAHKNINELLKQHFPG